MQQMFEELEETGKKGFSNSPLLPMSDSAKDLFTNWIDTAVALGFQGLTYHQGVASDSPIMGEALMSIVKSCIQAAPGSCNYGYKMEEKNMKWLYVSELQKAVRRSDLPAAIRAASALANSDPSYFWWRFPIIAIEDVGLGDPYALAAILTIAGNKEYKKEVGDEALAVFLTELMVKAPKSRLLCDMTVYMYEAPEIADDLPIFGTLNEEDLEVIYLDESTSLGHRLAAAWSLMGTSKWKNDRIIDQGFSLKAIQNAVDKMSLPPLIRYIERLYRRRSDDSMGLALTLLWNEYQSSDITTTYPELTNNGVKVGPWMSASMDKHTAVGKQAIGYFKKACQPMKKWLEQHSHLDAFATTARAIFLGEGGNLYPLISFSNSTELTKHLYEQKFAVMGLEAEEGWDLLQLIRDNEESLTYARKKVSDLW